jgi:3-oxoacid CoA-transferase A subunit
MIDKRVATVAEALAGLADGATIMIAGFGGSGLPAALLRALDKMPIGDLTLILNGPRAADTYAPRLFGDRRVRKVICSAARGKGNEPTAFERQWAAGELELEVVPQGTFAERIRAGGAGIPAFFSPTGYGTKLTEGKETRTIGGKPCVLETALTADFALLRANVADRWGNLSYKGTQANFGPAMASAARVTVVEATTVTEGHIPPEGTSVPGIYVHRVIELPDAR